MTKKELRELQALITLAEDAKITNNDELTVAIEIARELSVCVVTRLHKRLAIAIVDYLASCVGKRVLSVKTEMLLAKYVEISWSAIANTMAESMQTWGWLSPIPGVILVDASEKGG